MISKIFAPNYKKFYGQFDDMATTLNTLGDEFNSYIHSPTHKGSDEIVQKIYKHSERIMGEANDTMKELEANFITPFDREDIVVLVNSLDGMASHIRTTTKRIVMYKAIPTDDLMRQFGDIIAEGTRIINQSIHFLRDNKNKKQNFLNVEKLYDLESQGDDLYNEGLERLINDPSQDFKSFFMTKDLYQKMELITDEMENVGKVVEAILLKYS